MMLELRAAPLAPIRYSTEGSDPRNHGASYEGEFVVPLGTRLVLAVGEKQGVCSEVLRLDIDWTRPPEAKPIDREAAATWRPGEPFRFSETRTSYGFVNRLKKYQGQACDIQVRVVINNGKWADLNLEESIRLNGEQLEHVIEYLRGFAPEGEVSVEARYLAFPTGQQLLDYAEEIRLTLSRDEVQP